MEAGKGRLELFPTRAAGRAPKAQPVPADVSIGQDPSVLLLRTIGVVGHQLRVAWSFMVFFGHKYDSILPFLPAVGHSAAQHSDLAAIVAVASCHDLSAAKQAA